jgi:hypothetical protein
LHAARRQAAKELDLPIDDWRVIRLSTLVCAHETVQAKLASGQVIDVNHLLQIDTALAQARSAAAPAPSFRLEIVDGTFTVCPRCKYTEPTPAKPDDPPPADRQDGGRLLPQPASAVEAPSTAPKPSFERADNVVELVPDKLKARDFHRGRGS